MTSLWNSTADNLTFCHGGPGSINNDEIKFCKICTANGYRHEAIKIEKIPGRVLSNGSNETDGYRVVDYTTDKTHEHKEPRFYQGWDLEAF